MLFFVAVQLRPDIRLLAIRYLCKLNVVSSLEATLLHCYAKIEIYDTYIYISFMKNLEKPSIVSD